MHALLKLRDNLRVYYGCGYNIDKYQKYLQNGKLERKLAKYYTEEEIELIKNYLEEKQKEEGYSRKLK